MLTGKPFFILFFSLALAPAFCMGETEQRPVEAVPERLQSLFEIE